MNELNGLIEKFNAIKPNSSFKYKLRCCDKYLKLECVYCVSYCQWYQTLTKVDIKHYMDTPDGGGTQNLDEYKEINVIFEKYVYAYHHRDNHKEIEF